MTDIRGFKPRRFGEEAERKKIRRVVDYIKARGDWA